MLFFKDLKTISLACSKKSLFHLPFACHLHACMLSHGLFVTLWTVGSIQDSLAHLSMEFSRQEHWSRFPFLLQGMFLTQGLNPHLLYCRQILHHWPTGKAQRIIYFSTFPSLIPCSVSTSECQTWSFTAQNRVRKPFRSLVYFSGAWDKADSEKILPQLETGQKSTICMAGAGWETGFTPTLVRLSWAVMWLSSLRLPSAYIPGVVPENLAQTCVSITH